MCSEVNLTLVRISAVYQGLHAHTRHHNGGIKKNKLVRINNKIQWMTALSRQRFVGNWRVKGWGVKGVHWCKNSHDGGASYPLLDAMLAKLPHWVYRHTQITLRTRFLPPPCFTDSSYSHAFRQDCHTTDDLLLPFRVIYEWRLSAMCIIRRRSYEVSRDFLNVWKKQCQVKCLLSCILVSTTSNM